MHIKIATEHLTVENTKSVIPRWVIQVIPPEELSCYLLPIGDLMVLQGLQESQGLHLISLLGFLPLPLASLQPACMVHIPGGTSRSFGVPSTSGKYQGRVKCTTPSPWSPTLCCFKVSLDSLGELSASRDALDFSLNLSGVCGKLLPKTPPVSPVLGIDSGTWPCSLCPDLLNFFFSC